MLHCHAEIDMNILVAGQVFKKIVSVYVLYKCYISANYFYRRKFTQ